MQFECRLEMGQKEKIIEVRLRIWSEIWTNSLKTRKQTATDDHMNTDQKELMLNRRSFVFIRGGFTPNSHFAVALAGGFGFAILVSQHCLA